MRIYAFFVWLTMFLNSVHCQVWFQQPLQHVLLQQGALAAVAALLAKQPYAAGSAAAVWAQISVADGFC